MTPPPALLEALQKKDLAAAERALAAGESAVGWQSIVVAVAYRCGVDMLDLLLRHGADANEERRPSSRPTALIHAAGLQPHQHPDATSIVKRLLEAGADPLVEDDDRRSSLWWAARCGTAEVLACLLDAVRHVPRESLQPVMEEAVSAWEANAKLEALLAVDVPPSASAFVAACATSDETNARVLLARGMDVNAPDARGCTPLHRAVEGGRVALVEALLERGASLTAATKKSVPDSEIRKGDTPPMVAERQARHWQQSACEALLRVHSGRSWNVGATHPQHPATVDGAIAAAIQVCEQAEAAMAEVLRSEALRAEILGHEKVRGVLGLLERAAHIVERVGASPKPALRIHGKWKRLYVDDIEHGHVKGTATLELKKDGTFEAQLSREKLSGTFTHDASASAPLTLTSKKGPLEVEFDGTELRITRPTKKSEPDALAVTYFVFAPPK